LAVREQGVITIAREKLKQARQAKGLTQQDMAKLLGCTKSHYCMMENEQRGISVEKALQMSKILGKSVEDLFDFEVHELPRPAINE